MNTANPSARERLHAKIRALLAKTTEAGCTEAEALSAAALASDLMDRYNVEHGDLDGEPWHTEYTTREGAETRGTKRRKNARKAAFAFRALIYGEIGRYCHCHGIMNPDKGTIRFHGRHSDALFATWLLEALDAFAYRAWGGFEAIHALDDNFLVDSDKEAFMTALAHRLNERLKEARARRCPPPRRLGERFDPLAEPLHLPTHLWWNASRSPLGRRRRRRSRPRLLQPPNGRRHFEALTAKMKGETGLRPVAA